tara:strand:+ start:2796 stop:5015 length:2220 start_codon:yes stop_codon:yes gene_type:complete
MAKKAKSKQMTEDELVSIIDQEVRNSLGRDDGDLARQRQNSMEAYYGMALGNEVAGRSQIVTRDVLEVVEWAMPELLDVFTSDDVIARFSPNAEQDEDEARQATDYVNHVFFNENDGFQVLHDMFKDALMQKHGVTKSYWDDTPKTAREEYSGLDDFQFQNLVQDDDVEVLAHSEVALEDEGTIQALGLQGPLMLHDVEIERTTDDGRIIVEVVPPEEILISRRARSFDDARMITHRISKTISEIKLMFPDFDEDIAISMQGDDEAEFDEEYQARHEFDSADFGDAQFSDDGLSRKVWLTENYIKIDWDNDGYTELRKVTKAGTQVLENIEVDDHPFAGITPIPIPHKLFGMSLADITMDLQVTKSAILRNLLDNIYNLNHGRFEALDGQVNMDDLLTSRPGGVVRVKTAGALKRLDTPPIPNGGFEMVQYMDKLRDGRTGVSKFRTGLDTDFLNNAKAGPVDNQMEAANARLRLYARIFKETGVKKTFEKIYKNMVRHQQREKVLKLRGEWVTIDPSAWGGDCNVTVKTGLGHGDRAKKIQEMNMVGQQFGLLRQDPELRTMVSRENIYTAFSEGLRAMDYKNVGDFITDPKTLPPYKPQPDPKVQAEQAKNQVEMKKLELETQKLQMQMQADMQKNQQSAGLDQQKHQLEMQKAQLAAQQAQQKVEIEMAKLEITYRAEQEQNAIEQQKSQVEVMKVQADMAKMEAEIMLKEAEMVMKYEELALEKQQNRNVTLGTD